MLQKIILIAFFLIFVPVTTASEKLFEFQSIDTMKYSRDVAREKLKDASYDASIDTQVHNIAVVGATHVAIATPYDEEFIPFLRRWVSVARKYHLKVWFRGNLSGWEEWFGYQKISRDQHIQKIDEFIRLHPDIFEDGDVFTSCPECENGGPGDPRLNGDPEGHKQFLIDEYHVVKKAFQDIDKDVKANYYSMNGDVARLIMDKDTTAALDGVVTVDHYVRTGEQLVEDIKALAEQSGGRVVLGEFGAPIPDINGDLTEEQQAAWIDDAVSRLVDRKELIGMSYWTNKGGSTKLWNDDDSPRQVVTALKKYFKPKLVAGTVQDELGRKMEGVTVNIDGRSMKSTRSGEYTIAVLNDKQITLTKAGYISISSDLPEFTDQILTKNFVMKPQNPSFLYNLIIQIYELLGLRTTE